MIFTRENLECLSKKCRNLDSDPGLSSGFSEGCPFPFQKFRRFGTGRFPFGICGEQFQIPAENLEGVLRNPEKSRYQIAFRHEQKQNRFPGGVQRFKIALSFGDNEIRIPEGFQKFRRGVLRRDAGRAVARINDPLCNAAESGVEHFIVCGKV